MIYTWMAPPFEMKPFNEMNKKEAQQYFEWYTGEIPERIKILDELTEDWVTLDYTKESLIDLFSWYLKVITIREMSEEEIGAELEQYSQYPKHIYDDMKQELLENPVDLEKIDYAIAMDIAIYYGETIRKNYPQVKWTYFTKPKSYVYLNEPLLHFQDAKDELISYEREPRSLMLVLVHKIKEQDVTEMELYETFLMDEESILGIFEDPED